MKSSDFLDENILKKAGSAVWNWAGSKGYLGKGQFVKSQHVAAKEAGRADFIMKLKSALEAGRQSGSIAESSEYLDKLSYKKFSSLLESTILAEAISVDDYLRKYVGAMVQSYKIDASEKAELDRIISNFSAAYARGKFPTSEANKIWDWIWLVGSAQTRDPKTQQVIGDPSRSGLSGAEEPADTALPIGAAPRDVPPDKKSYAALPIATSMPNPQVQVTARRGATRTFQYMFDKNSWFDVTDPAVAKIVKDAASVQKLNVLYHRTYRI